MEDDEDRSTNAINGGGGAIGIGGVAGGRDEFMDLLQRLTLENPHVLYEDNAGGMFGRRHVPLLHYAVLMGFSLPVIRFLVGTTPALVRSLSLDGKEHALHCAGPNSRRDVCRFLINSYPEALQHRDLKGRIPLHSALLLRAPIDIVLLYLEMWPESVRIRKTRPPTSLIMGPAADDDYDPCVYDDCEEGGLPIHIASQGDEATLVGVLVPRWPESLLEPDARGRTPLHVAAQYSLGVDGGQDMVRELLRVDPMGRDALRVRDRRGYYPLHACLTVSFWRPEMEGKARLILSEWEGAARVADDWENLPVHHAATNGAPGLVRHLVNVYPESVLCLSNCGSLPIHRAMVALSPNVEVVRLLAEPRPEALLVKNSCGWTPLHQMISLLSLRTVEDFNAFAAMLVSLATESLLVPSSTDGSLPVHCLVGHDFIPVDTLRILVDPCPESLLVPNAAGSLPVHLAASRLGAPDEDIDDIVRFLVERSPGSLRVRDLAGNLPLHLAMANTNLSLTRLRILVEPFPASLLAPDSEGLMPLIVAVRSANNRVAVTASVADEFPGDKTDVRSRFRHWFEPADRWMEVVRRLVEASPESLRVADPDGNLPIHWAASPPEGACPARAEVLRLLVEPWPESLWVPNSMGSLPLHRAVSHRMATVEVARFLIREGGSQTLQRRDAEGYPPFLRAALANAPLDVIFELVSAGPVVEVRMSSSSSS